MDLREECGVFGVFCPKPAALAEMVYYGLYALQHRGQESCGIVVNEDGVFSSYKDLGLVSEVFSGSRLMSFPKGRMAVGHVRYGTTGGTNRANCQPMEVNHQKGKMALAHNGNISNAAELRNALELSGAIFHTTSDTETIAYIVTRERLRTASIEEALIAAMNKLDGAYSLILMSAQKLICARDPYGFRPLCYGRRADGAYVAASESCALKAVGAEFIRDLEPGEVLVFSQEGIVSHKEHCGEQKKRLCVFEYIYFARPDSVLDGVSVQGARLQAGRALAKAHPVEADLVVGVPDSGLDAALGYHQESGIPYGIGLIKNKYIGRTFISPGETGDTGQTGQIGQTKEIRKLGKSEETKKTEETTSSGMGSRMDQVRIKLSAVEESIRGKRIVLIDDSIVRGTTSGQIVRLLREAGAKEVHMRISSPPFLHPCYYGTDIDSEEHLVACHHTIEETAELIGADSLGYLPLADLAVLAGGCGYCGACFHGDYPTAVPTDTRKNRFEQKLSAAVAVETLGDRHPGFL